MKSDPFVGNYLFHLHTRFTDGEPRVRDYFDCCALRPVDRLIFLEHIRRTPTYCVDDFVREIRAGERQSHVEAVIGFEAKVLADGTLDISNEHFQLAEVVGIAEHGFPSDPSMLQSCMFRVFDHCSLWLGKKHFVWVHPGLSLRKAPQTEAIERALEVLLKRAEQCGIHIERNLRYDLVSEETASRLTAGTLVIGIDAHKLQDLQRLS